MDYVSPKEAQDLPGLRLALTAGLPAPWSMMARFLFDVKGIPYTPVLQVGGEANEDLVRWTGHRNAPVAVYGDETPKVNWTEIIELAERLAPEPRLVPEDIDDRMLMFGLANEICGAGGLTWSMRQTMMSNMERAVKKGVEDLKPRAERFSKSYGYVEGGDEAAIARMQQILERLSRQLGEQKAKGSSYFVGDGLTAVDLIWASFSNTLRPLPEEVNPMPEPMRKMYTRAGDLAPPDANLLAHRDFIYETHLSLPLTF